MNKNFLQFYLAAKKVPITKKKTDEYFDSLQTTLNLDHYNIPRVEKVLFSCFAYFIQDMLLVCSEYEKKFFVSTS